MHINQLRPFCRKGAVGSPVGTTFSGVSVGAVVAVAGTGEMVGNGTAVSVGETTVTAGAHEVKIRATSNTVLMFLTFVGTPLYKKPPD